MVRGGWFAPLVRPMAAEAVSNQKGNPICKKGQREAQIRRFF